MTVSCIYHVYYTLYTVLYIQYTVYNIHTVYRSDCTPLVHLSGWLHPDSKSSSMYVSTPSKGKVATI
jgi:hypothetical protein